MALSPSALGALIDSNLTSKKATGYNKTKFSNAVALGIVMSIVGKAFVTSDVGTTAGTGAGIGTGIIGLDESSMESIALSVMKSTGYNAENLMNAIMNATKTHLLNATLTSVDAPVYLGAGTIVVGSITVVESEMGNNIDSQLASIGAIGKNRTNLSQAIAAGVCRQILSNGTGALIITGGGPPPPVPGAGSGTGTIS